MTPRAPTAPATVFAWSATRFAGAPAALFALDAALGDVVRGTRTPMVGQMRLTWWHDALHALDHASAPAQPVLRALKDAVLPHVAGAALAGTIDGWDVLIEEDAPDAAALARYAEARGGALFAALATVLGREPDAAARAAGRCWALADLAGHVEADALAREAARLATATIPARSARRTLRVIGALHADARLAAAGSGQPGGPRRAATVLRRIALGR